jgi:hypothetical protein
MSMTTSSTPWMVGSLPFTDFIAPADCSSWELRLRLPPGLGRKDVAVAPGGHPHRRCGSLLACLFTLTLIFLHLFALGTLAPLSQASKFVSFSALIANGRHSFFHAAACLNVDVCPHTLPAICRPTSSAATMSSACLPNLHPCHRHCSCASAIVIVIILCLLVLSSSSLSSSSSIPCSSGTSIFLFYVIFLFLLFL